MIEVEKLNTSKEKILSTIRSKGPSLPVQIAREIGFSPLFASAFLSELKAEEKIKISNLRVGSSPLYYLPGQEPMLEKFVPYLNQREKEAFQLLKQKQVLEDAEQEPVMRVALRAIKDFAFSVKIRVDGESKLFWKHFALSDENVVKMVNETVDEKKPEEIVQPLSVAKPVEEEKEIKQQTFVSTGEIEEREERPLAEKKKIKVKESEFVINVKDYLGAKDIEVLQVLLEKKKEFEAKIRTDTIFGKQTYYLIAKEKKSINDIDLSLALQKARGENLPAVLMSQGDLNKKGKQHLEQWGNLVKFEKLKF